MIDVPENVVNIAGGQPIDDSIDDSVPPAAAPEFDYFAERMKIRLEERYRLSRVMAFSLIIAAFCAAGVIVAIEIKKRAAA